MKRLVLLIMFLILLVGCSKTKVIHYDGSQDQNVVVIEQNQIAASVKQEVVSNDSTSVISSHNNDGTSSSDASTSSATSNPSGEYTMASCCDEGRLYATASKERAAYTQNDIRTLLLNIYANNCNNLKGSEIQRIYLRFSGDIQDSSYLTYFKDTEYKRIQVDYMAVDSNFEACG